MAFCANCGKEMSDAATACPNCGHPNPALGSEAKSYGRPLAGFGIRLLSLFVDGVLLFILNRFVLGDLPVLQTTLGFLYGWLMLGLNDGRTLAAMLLGIRIANPDGSRLTLGTAAARQGMALVSGLAVGIGYLWAAWDPEKRTWHDMVANTRAFREGR